MWKTNRLVQDLNSCRRVHFHWRVSAFVCIYLSTHIYIYIYMWVTSVLLPLSHIFFNMCLYSYLFLSFFSIFLTYIARSRMKNTIEVLVTRKLEKIIKLRTCGRTTGIFFNTGLGKNSCTVAFGHYSAGTSMPSLISDGQFLKKFSYNTSVFYFCISVTTTSISYTHTHTRTPIYIYIYIYIYCHSSNYLFLFIDLKRSFCIDTYWLLSLLGKDISNSQFVLFISTTNTWIFFPLLAFQLWIK